MGKTTYQLVQDFSHEQYFNLGLLATLPLPRKEPPPDTPSLPIPFASPPNPSTSPKRRRSVRRPPNWHWRYFLAQGGAPEPSSKWTSNPYNWSYKWATGVINPYKCSYNNPILLTGLLGPIFWATFRWLPVAPPIRCISTDTKDARWGASWSAEDAMGLRRWMGDFKLLKRTS